MVDERIMPQLKKERYHKINLLFAAILFVTGIFNIIWCVLAMREPLVSTLISIDVLLLILLGSIFLALYFLPAIKWLKNTQILMLFGIGFMMIPTNPPDNFSGHIFIILSLFLSQRYGLLNKNLPQKLISLSVLLAGSITLSIITFEGS